MRLRNFSILLGSGKVTVSDLTATEPEQYLIVSGVIGADVTNLERGGSNRFWAFESHFGDDSDENPYGNTNVYNTGSVNTSTALELSQSLSAPVTGSAQASFLFIVERDYRG